MEAAPRSPAALFTEVAEQNRALLLKTAANLVGWEDAEDVLQAGLEKGWRSLAQFRYGELNEMRGWLCRVIRTTALDYLAYRDRRRCAHFGLQPRPEDKEMDGSWLLDPEDTEGIVLRREAVREAHEQAMALLARCSLRQRRAIWWSYGQGDGQRELAERWHVKVQTFKTWRERGRQRCLALAAHTP